MMRTEVTGHELDLEVIPDGVSALVDAAAPATEAVLSDPEIFAAEFAGQGAGLNADIDDGGVVAPRAAGEGYSPEMATFIVTQAAMGRRMPWLQGTVRSYANDRSLARIGIVR